MKKNITLIEVSYEVANKVGGIYTALVSKMGRMHENIRDYHAVGPYYESSANSEFEPVKKPEKILRLHEKIEKQYGIRCHYGRWNIKEKPLVTLVDTAGFKGQINNVKKGLWEEYRIDSINSDSWFDEPVIWSKAVGIVIEEMIRAGVFRNPVVHFHEWLTGAGLLHLKSAKIGVPTVFTTHSTVLGRSIAEVGKEGLHEMIALGLKEGRTIEDSKAYEYNVQAKHLMEKAAAYNASVFTTVSEITGNECRFILGKAPDVLLPNGLDTKKFPLMEDLSNLHIIYRDHTRRFVLSYFSPYYDIDITKTLFFFIAGRQEIRNKGIDIFIDSLGKLNEQLKASKSKRIVVVFIWVPAHTLERIPTVTEHMAMFENIEEKVQLETQKIERRIVRSFARGKLPSKSRIFDMEFLDYMKKMKLEMRGQKGQPPLCPFVLDADNPVMKLLEKNGLQNGKDDNVKIIYYPIYLSVADGLLNLNYYNAIIGCHVGVFPSYYEPWGFTPLETAALGLQSITTDLAGFGKFIQKYLKKNEYGIMVIPREGKEYGESVDCLANTLQAICEMNKRQRIESKIMAKELSAHADWRHLILNYMKAYDMALKK